MSDRFDHFDGDELVELARQVSIVLLENADPIAQAGMENAFPGMTLREVLAQGGGGLIALGRHTVAALLNAESADVNYGMAPDNVIDAFNAVYPGSNPTYNMLKGDFEYANESGCPLN